MSDRAASSPSRVLHHIDQSDRTKCAVCGDLWPCLTFLAFLGGDVRFENMGHSQRSVSGEADPSNDVPLGPNPGGES